MAYHMSDIMKSHWEFQLSIGIIPKHDNKLNICGIPFNDWNKLLEVRHAVDVAMVRLGGNTMLMPVVVAQTCIPQFTPQQQCVII